MLVLLVFTPKSFVELFATVCILLRVHKQEGAQRRVVLRVRVEQRRGEGEGKTAPPGRKAVAPCHNLEGNVLDLVDDLSANHSDAGRRGHGHAISLGNAGLPVGRGDEHLGNAAGRDGHVVLERRRCSGRFRGFQQRPRARRLAVER